MTLRHLRIFVAVCQWGGVTAAAEKLYLSQPSVSVAVGELESYYGIRLFDRIGRRLRLTEVGKQFLGYATHIVKLFDELEQRVRNWDELGRLRVGASITIGNYLLPGYTAAFRAHYPGITVHALIDNSEGIERGISDGSLDFALIEGLAHTPQLVTRPFREDELVVICAPGHPLAGCADVEARELVQYDFIMRERGSAGREIFDSAMLLKGLAVDPVWQSASTQAIVRAVGAGLGLSALPLLLVGEDLEKGTVVRLPVRDLPLKRSFSVLYHRNKYLTPAMLDFIGLCR